MKNTGQTNISLILPRFMRLSTKIAYNTIIQVASKMVSTILGLIAIAVMTRSLGQEGFGKYTTIMTFLSFFSILADFGLTLVTSQMVSEPEADAEKVMGNLLSWRFLSALVFLGVGPWLVFLFPYESGVKIGVLIAAASFFFSAISQIMVGFFQKELRMDKVSIAEVSSRFLLLVGIYAAVFFSWGLFGFLWATVVSSLGSLLMHYLFARQFVHLRLLFDFDLWHRIWRHSWPIAITIAFNLIYLKADTLILSLVRSQAEVGIYGAAYKAIDVLITVPFMFAGIILPILTANWLAKNKDGYSLVLQKSVDLMVIIALPLAVGTQFVAKEVMVMIAGAEFAASGQALRILIVAAAMIFIGCMFSHAVIAIGQQKRIIWAYVVTSLTSLAGYLYFIPKYSYLGAAWMTVYSESLIAICAAVLVVRSSGFVFSFRVASRVVLATAIMAITVYSSIHVAHVNLWSVVLLAIIVYFVFLYWIGGITKKDLLSLINR